VKWAARIIALLLLLLFALMFLQMHKTLVRLQEEQQGTSAR
jgi:hypothetical protein